MTEDIDARIEKYEQELRSVQLVIEKLKQEKKRLAALAPEYALAEYLHSKICTLNHTDGCGWFYEDWNKNNPWTKTRYLNRAKQIISDIDKLRVSPVEPTALDLAKIILESPYV